MRYPSQGSNLGPIDRKQECQPFIRKVSLQTTIQVILYGNLRIFG
jgi:hypothetical protein